MAKIDIAGELNPATTERVLADAKVIKDRTQDKNQETINNETKEKLGTHDDEIASLQSADTTLDEKIDDVKELLDSKVIEAGGVPFDTIPTEGSTNPVTSDGIYKSQLKFVLWGDATDDGDSGPGGVLITPPKYVDDLIEFKQTISIDAGDIVKSTLNGNTIKAIAYNTTTKTFVATDDNSTWHNNWSIGDAYNKASAYGTIGDTGVTPDTTAVYLCTDTVVLYKYKDGNLTASSSGLSLGTTSGTAFPGDKGQVAYTHAVTNKGKGFASGFYKITTNTEGHITAATPITKNDITSLGIPAQDTTYNAATTLSDGLMSKEDKTKLDGIETEANNYVLPTATAEVLGGIKTGYIGSGANYPVKTDSEHNAYVTVGSAIMNKLTQAEYDELQTKDSNTIYFIIG